MFSGNSVLFKPTQLFHDKTCKINQLVFLLKLDISHTKLVLSTLSSNFFHRDAKNNFMEQIDINTLHKLWIKLNVISVIELQQNGNNDSRARPSLKQRVVGIVRSEIL
jgi:hypothetical protein